MKEITVQELSKMKDNNTPFVLIDVREQHEYNQANIGGTLIPLGSVPTMLEEFPTDGKVIIHCRSGRRSASAIELVEDYQGNDNLYNLKGGILAYAKEIDDSLCVD